MSLGARAQRPTWWNFHYLIFTDLRPANGYKGKGYVFTGVCLSTGERGCVAGVCVAGGYAWQGGVRRRVGAWRGACMAGGDMHGRGACMAVGCAWQDCAWQGACMAGGVYATHPPADTTRYGQ